MLALAGCTEILEPRDALDKNGPARSTSVAQQSDTYELFADAYAPAFHDDRLIAKGLATAGKAFDKLEPVAIDWNKIPTEIPKNYSPLNYCKYTDDDTKDAKTASDAAAAEKASAQKELEAAANTLAAKSAALASVPAGATNDAARAKAQAESDAAAKAMSAAIAKQTAASAAAKSTADTLAKTVKDKPKAGCSYQSQHARAMAVRGFQAVDQNCHDFFRAKGLMQQQFNLVSDTSTTLTSLAGGAAGAATGIAALPSATSILTAFTGGSASILNKDLLFGDTNIRTTYNMVESALVAHTVSALPEPDNSDWNFKRALEAIRSHQDICRVENILLLIKSSAAVAKPAAQPAACTTAGQNPAARPATGTETVTVTPATCPPAPAGSPAAAGAAAPGTAGAGSAP